MCVERGACQGDMGIDGGVRGVGWVTGRAAASGRHRARQILTSSPAAPSAKTTASPALRLAPLPPQLSLQSSCQLNYINVKKPISSAGETEPGKHDAVPESRRVTGRTDASVSVTELQ